MRIFGFDASQVRERAAALFYSSKTTAAPATWWTATWNWPPPPAQPHLLRVFPLPPGAPEGDLPPGDFVLASPLAGWRSKQWPAEHYATLAARLRREWNIPLVLNSGCRGTEIGAVAHVSGLPGLIDATRRAAAVVGVDSGPHASGRRARQARRGHFRPHRSGAQRPVWRIAAGSAQPPRRHHLQTRRRHRRRHAPDHSRRGFRGPEAAAKARRAPPDATFPKPYADAVARLRVPSGFLIVAVFAWFSHPTRASLLSGAPVALLGLALRAWAAGCLAKNRELATGGPYAYTRNPLYLGTLLVAAGLVVASRSILLGALFAAVSLWSICRSSRMRSSTCGGSSPSTPVTPRAFRLSGRASARRQKARILFVSPLSKEPRVSSRIGIGRRDAVSDLEVAGLSLP